MKKVILTVFTVVLCLSLSAWAQNKVVTIQDFDLRPTGDPDGGIFCGTNPPDCDQPSNGGFESGAFPPWVRGGDPSFTAIAGPPVAHSGLWGLNIGPVQGLGWIEQCMPTVPDQEYRLTFWLRNAQTPNRFQVSWDGAVIYDQTDMPDFAYTCSKALPVGDTSVFESLIGGPGDCTVVRFSFFNIPDFFWFDDVCCS